MKLKVLNISTNKSTSFEVADTIFAREFNQSLVHQVTTAYMAGGRQGSKAQKNRAAVSGGGKKPWAQKGTGRARAGTSRGPIWRSGGVTFAAQPRSYTQKINKKMYRAGIRSIFSELLRQDRLVVSDEMLPESPKTKDMIAKLSVVDAKRVLILVEELTENLILATRNIPYVEVATVSSLDPVTLVSADKVIATAVAVKQVEERLA